MRPIAATRLVFLVVLSALASTLVIARPAAAAPSPAQKCTQTKLGASGKAIAAQLKCYAVAAGKAAAVDALCLGKAGTLLQKVFDKADDKGGCAVTGDGPTVAGIVDGCTNAVVAALGSAAGKSVCLKGKLGTAGKKAKDKLQCAAKGAASGLLPATECLAKVETKYLEAWTKLETKNDGCATLGDAAAVEAIIDHQCFEAAAGALGLPTPSPTPTTTVTPTLTVTPTKTPTPIPTMTSGVSFTVPGTYAFVAPPGVTEVSAVVVGGGGGGGALYGTGAGGGGGGALCWSNNIPVSPGFMYAVVVGAGGAAADYDDPSHNPGCCQICVAGVCQPGCGCSNYPGGTGGDSSFAGGLLAHGGTGFGGFSALGDYRGVGGQGGTQGTCFSGGNAGFNYRAGGAAGYAGAGGNALEDGTGGSGGGGYNGRGGDVGLRGIGASGATGNAGHFDGYPGSQIDATDPVAGGGGSGYSGAYPGAGSNGGVRIIFKPGFAYPAGDR